MTDSVHRYSACVQWQGADPKAFRQHRYSRAHHWHFDGGLSVPASSSPQIVRLPWSDAHAVDPEEAFVASLSSCHMLFFLDFAARGGGVVERYRDEAWGEMGADELRRVRMLRVRLQPQVSWTEAEPTASDVTRWHHQAHEACFLANSVRCVVEVCGPGGALI